MAMTQKEYEDLRDRVIQKYRILYKDAQAMDMCEVPPEVRMKMFEDPYYISKTKALKAGLFAEQLDYINHVLGGSYQGDKPTDQSNTVLKAIEMRQKILLEDIGINKDESNIMNIAFIGMTAEEFEKVDTVTVHKGSNNGDDLGVDFSASEGGDNSFEDRLKADVEKRLSELGDREGGE